MTEEEEKKEMSELELYTKVFHKQPNGEEVYQKWHIIPPTPKPYVKKKRQKRIQNLELIVIAVFILTVIIIILGGE